MASGSSFNIDILVNAARALSSLTNIRAAIGHIGSAAVSASADLAKLGSAAGIAALGVAIHDTVAGMKELERASARLGISATALSQYTVAMKSVGIESDKVVDILKDMSEKIGEALVAGGGEGAEALKLLNLQASDLLRAAPEKRLLMIAGALGKIKSQDTKIFVMEQLANDASMLLPLLENNAAKLNELTAAAEKSGAAFSDLDRERLRPASDSLTQLGNQFEATGKIVSTALAPAVDKWATDLLNYIKWITPELDKLATRFANVAKEAGWLPAIADVTGLANQYTASDRAAEVAWIAANRRAELPGQIGTTRGSMAGIQQQIEALSGIRSNSTIPQAVRDSVLPQMAALAKQYGELNTLLEQQVAEFQRVETAAHSAELSAAAEAKAKEKSAQAQRDASVEQGLATAAAAQAAKGQAAADAAHKKALADAAREYKEEQDKQWRLDSDRFETEIKGDEARAKAIDDELTKQFEAEWRRIEAVDAADERRLQALQQQTAEYQRMGSYIGQAIIAGNGLQAIGQVAGSQIDTMASGAASGWLAKQGAGAATSGLLGGIAGGLAGAAVSQVIGSIFSSETDRVVEGLRAVRESILNSRGVLSGERAAARAASSSIRWDASLFGQGPVSSAISAAFPTADAKLTSRIVESARILAVAIGDTDLALKLAISTWAQVGINADQASSDIQSMASELQTLFDAIPKFEQWAGITTAAEQAQSAIDAFNATLADGLPKLDGTKESAAALWKATAGMTQSNLAARSGLINLTDEIDTLAESASAAAQEMGDTGLIGQIENMLQVMTGGINAASKATTVFVNLAAEARRIAVDPRLSILKPGQRTAEAGAQFWALNRTAQQGGAAGVEAAQQMGAAANTYLESARQQYASGSQYTAIYNAVTSALQGPAKQYMTIPGAGGTAGTGLVDDTSVLGLIAKLSKTDNTAATRYLTALTDLTEVDFSADSVDGVRAVTTLVQRATSSGLADGATNTVTIVGELIKTGKITGQDRLASVVADLIKTNTLTTTGAKGVIDELVRAGLISTAAATNVEDLVDSMIRSGAAASAATGQVSALGSSIHSAALAMAQATAAALASAAGTPGLADALTPSLTAAYEQAMTTATGATQQTVAASTGQISAARLDQIVYNLGKAAGWQASGYFDDATNMARIGNSSMLISEGARRNEAMMASAVWTSLLKKQTPLPAYMSGSPYIASDQLAQIHKGEMVIDPQSSNALRKYGITVTSDNPATIRVMQEMRDEIVELRRTVSRQTGALAAGVRA